MKKQIGAALLEGDPDLPAFLVMLRGLHNWEQEDLADRVGVSQPTVSRWENAETAPQRVNLMALAECAQVQVGDIIAVIDRTVLIKESRAARRLREIADLRRENQELRRQLGEASS